MSLQLPEEYHNRLTNEFRLATSKMAEAESPRQYLYYFSVFFGELVRVLNWHWDETLALIWSNIQHTHNAVSNRVNASMQGDRAVELSEEYFAALTMAAMDLVEYVEKLGDEAELCGILARFAELTYASTGNGHYLVEKGVIKL